jgi:hypothetical protein
MRATETAAALQTWFEVDPRNASEWVAKSGLPDEVKAQLVPPHS